MVLVWLHPNRTSGLFCSRIQGGLWNIILRSKALQPLSFSTACGSIILLADMKRASLRLPAAVIPNTASDFSWKTIPQGAATSVWAGFVAPADVVGGKFCEDCHVAEVVDSSDLRGGVRPYALNPERARALWAKSEEMVGEKF
jgi:hypothetical protein